MVPISEEYDGQSIMQMNDRLQLDLTDNDLPLLIGHASAQPIPLNQELLKRPGMLKDRSRTPTRDTLGKAK